MAPVALGAGGTGGDADAVLLQKVQGVLGGHTGDGQGQNVGRLVGAVDPDASSMDDLTKNLSIKKEEVSCVKLLDQTILGM